jgi:hypothetical protein
MLECERNEHNERRSKNERTNDRVRLRITEELCTYGQRSVGDFPIVILFRSSKLMEKNIVLYMARFETMHQS